MPYILLSIMYGMHLYLTPSNCPRVAIDGRTQATYTHQQTCFTKQPQVYYNKIKQRESTKELHCDATTQLIQEMYAPDRQINSLHFENFKQHFRTF